MNRRGFLLGGGLVFMGAPAMANAPPELQNAFWTLETIDGAPVTAERKPQFSITPGGRLEGFNGCNRFFAAGDFSADGAAKIGVGASTRMACAGEAMALEQRFSAVLAGVNRWSLTGGALTLSGPAGALVLKR